jgi:hypothetical protein
MKKPKQFKARSRYANIRVNDKTTYKDSSNGKRYTYGPEVWIDSSGISMRVKTAKKLHKWLGEAVKYLESKES